MNSLISIFVFVLFCLQNSVAQEFGWLGSGFVANSPSNATYPGGRKGSSVWQDSAGNVWMFGGLGFPPGARSSSKPVPLNDLWRFSMEDKLWKLENPGGLVSAQKVEGNDLPSPRYLAAACGVSDVMMVVYGGVGLQGVPVGDTWIYYFKKKRWLPLTNLNNFTSEKNNGSSPLPAPMARGDAASWCLPESMYVFGGTDGAMHLLDDLWKFSLKDLKWQDMGPVVTSDVSGMSPRGRSGASTWTGLNQMLYMFGGNMATSGSSDLRNGKGYGADLWRLSPGNHSWLLLKGTTKPGTYATFGRLEEPSEASQPGSRCRAVTWVDTAGNLWMFGGDGTDASMPSQYRPALLLSDLWRYTLDVHMWVWMGGSDHTETEAAFIRPGTMSGSALPGARTEGMGWQGKNNQFFLFGGLGWDGMKQVGFLNDVWEVDVSMMVGFHTIVPGGYIFLLLFLAVGLVVGLVVASIFAKDRQGSGSLGRRLDYNVKYSQLGEGLD